ncbi:MULTISPECIES: DUF6072 family protein [Acidobacterium]|uniref:Uncharacterized protein n=1 Tax=Acidobacterium capsulatum (strain ATCC 51196 / DSM 11244 / BCRC 80197 / JCM 7670 / NBRC 15755 / NCIMB 13165 / 161) TaxID=240015 RepID=C1F4N3_ACIC5|nr:MULTISPECIES: DUF6072 family protein [Acidobacterium]ACO32086.1 hypothetical protein ACP_1149 [Acidobacterium capsulatum ATCC 51196]HCT60372.1 hypothetical protein [Acidobacterium sp.]
MKVDSTQAMKTGIQFAGEVILPGGSNLVSGDYKAGGIYAALGLAAKAVFGVPGLLVVSASSFANAVTGKNLIDFVKSVPPLELGAPMSKPVSEEPAS